MVICGGGLTVFVFCAMPAYEDRGDVVDDAEIGGVDIDAEVTLGEVPLDEGILRSPSFSFRNMSVPILKTLTPVETISLTVGTPSRMVTRFRVVSSRKISSRNGA